MRGFGWTGCVLSLVLGIACGGKAEKDGPVEEPSAGASGAAPASGGAGGATTGGALATTGGVVAAGGVVGVGGQTTSTGGAATRPEPGTELWFSRGYTLLTPEFYDQLLSDVFAVSPAEPGSTPFGLGSPAGGIFGFTTTSPAFADDAALRETAEQFVARLSDEQLVGPLGCGGGHVEPVLDQACAESVSTLFARHMWRREVAADESAQLMALFADAAPGAEADALREMVRAIVTSKDAYTLPTLGTEEAGEKYRLSDVELAGWLAVGLTGMPPDDELLETALADKLDLPSEAERLLGSDGARRRIAALIRRWFGLRSREQLWLFEDQVALTLSMYEETRRFIESVVFDDPQPLSSLVTADFSIIDSSLATLVYGLDSPRGPDYERVDLSATRRRGIPGQASYLVSTSYEGGPSYPLRSLVPLRLICEELPSPPLGVNPPPPAPGVASRRDQFDGLTLEAACAGCHRVMNPVAYSFDHFDESGVYVEIDRNGFPVDSSGSSTTFRGSTFVFEDSADLMEQLAKTPEYSECFVRNAVGWLVGVGNGEPEVLDYVARGHEPGDDEQVLAAIRRFVNSDHFRYRKQ